MYIRSDERKKECCVNLNGSEMELLAKMMIGFKSDSERENGLAAKIVCKYLQEKNYAESSPGTLSGLYDRAILIISEVNRSIDDLFTGAILKGEKDGQFRKN